MNQFFKELFCRHKFWSKGKFYPYSETHLYTCKSCGKRKMFKAGNSPAMGSYGR